MSGKQTPPSAARPPPTPLSHSDHALGSAVPRSKYGNQKTEINGIVFASRKEARRYAELRLLQTGKVISDLTLQPVYPLMIGSVRIGKYVGDFAYYEKGQPVCEDVKGMRTPVFNLKWRIVKALNPHIDWRII